MQKRRTLRNDFLWFLESWVLLNVVHLPRLTESVSQKEKNEFNCDSVDENHWSKNTLWGEGAAKGTIIFRRFYFHEVACNYIYSSIILISVAVVI